MKSLDKMAPCHRLETAEAYRQWRERFPWSDEAIAAAIEGMLYGAPNDYMRGKILGMADRCRTGRVSSGIMRYALPLLVAHCARCGRTALYRVGAVGYCAAHKGMGTQRRTHVITTMYEPGATEKERMQADRDKERRSAERHHRDVGRSRHVWR